MTYARNTYSHGTGTTIVIVSDSSAPGMVPIVSPTAPVLSNLIAAGGSGLRLDAIDPRVVADLRSLGLCLDRTRRSGFVSLVGNVSVVDQRTFAREVA